MSAKLKPANVFVSHSHRDGTHPLFKQLLNDLQREPQIKVWYSRDELQAGDSILESITRGIHDAGTFLFVVSKHARLSRSLLYELQFAMGDQLSERRAKVIPVLIDKVPLPAMVRSLKMIDLTSNYEDGFQELLEVIVTTAQSPIVTFPIDKFVAESPILEVADTVGCRMVEYFARHPKELKVMNRRRFEEMVAELWNGFGYDVELTKQTRDGGRDIIAVKNAEISVQYLIECKRPDPGGYVGIRPVRELYGVKCDERATKAILATTAFFSKDALLFFENHKWELEPKDYTGLLKWIHAYLKKMK